MIFIKSLKLTNFGRHESIAETFDGFTVGLAGPNGRGKSTILQALQFLLRGSIETDPAEPLRNFIRASSAPGAPKFAEVEGEFVADGKKGRLVRRITRTTVTRSLWWEGSETPEKPITSDKEVSRIMTEILGVDANAMSSTVFIRQGQMDAMFGKDAKRRDFYAELLMLGPMAKIADKIEPYRVSVESSTGQNLAAVRDSAEAAYEEAKAFYEAEEEAAKTIPDQSSVLPMVRRVQALMDDQESCLSALEKASAATSAFGGAPGDAGGFDAWAVSVRTELLETVSRRDSLIQARDAHASARALRAEAAGAERLYNDRLALFEALDAAKAEASSLKEVGEDPESEVARLKDLSDKFARRNALTEAIPGLKSQLSDARADEEKLKAAVSAAEASRSDLRDTYSELQNTISLRSSLLEALSHSHNSSEECPLCYSKSRPDVARIEADQAADKRRLEDMATEGSRVSQELKLLKSQLQTATSAAGGYASQVQAATSELQTLSVTLFLHDQETVAASLAEAIERKKIYSEALWEWEAAERAVAAAEAKVYGMERPDPSEMDEILRTISTAEADMETWAPLASASEEVSRLSEKASSLRDQLDKAASDVANLNVAKQRFEDACAALSVAHSELPDGIFDEVMTGTSQVITAHEVSEKLRLLETRQQEYDAARGRVDAAETGMKNANRRVVELETRLAEQKHRLDLVRDLAKLRDAFKPDGASMDYINYKFGKIARVAGDYLAESGADFIVAPSETTRLSYDFLRTDRDGEAWLPQLRLSGGQKVRLAVATLRAIHSEIIPNVGLMVLDEPTTHLDDETQRAMADMLQKIGEEGTLQMFVCDHSPILIEAFSDIIKIPS